MLCWEWEPGDKPLLVLDAVGFWSPKGLVVEGKAQAPPKGSVTAGPWTVSNGCALIAWVTWPLEGLPTMDPPESDTSDLTTPVTGLAWTAFCRDCAGVPQEDWGLDWSGVLAWLEATTLFKLSWYLFSRSWLRVSNCAFLCSSWFTWFSRSICSSWTTLSIWDLSSLRDSSSPWYSRISEPCQSRTSSRVSFVNWSCC